jgi:hypothetical protein
VNSTRFALGTIAASALLSCGLDRNGLLDVALPTDRSGDEGVDAAVPPTLGADAATDAATTEESMPSISIGDSGTDPIPGPDPSTAPPSGGPPDAPLAANPPDDAGGAEPDATDGSAPVSVDAAGPSLPEAGAESSTPSADAGPGPVGTPMTPPDAASPPCNPTNPFGTPVLVGGLLSTATEGGLRLSPDELTGTFWSTRPGGPGTVNLYVATRASLTAPFGGITLLAGVNAAGSQFDPTVSGDGLTLVFGSNRATLDGPYDLYEATRKSAADDFSGLGLLSALDTTFDDQQPFLLPDASALYFSSDRTGESKILRASASRLLGFSLATPVTELNQTGANDQHPAVSADDRLMFFASDRAGGLGDLDIWMAGRTSASSMFAAPVDTRSVNSTGKDIPDWISADTCRLYLHSDRGADGQEHEYVATRP